MKLIIKELRESKNKTQDEIVALSGIKKRTYVDYENGKADIPLSKLQNIATALQVAIFDLIEESNSEYVKLISEPKSTYSKNQIDYREKLIESLESQNLDLKKDKIELQKDKELLAKIITNSINK
ncbi:helix-turn-helix domain-containing protein [Flavobacterium sp. 5]|uniref:helix-turn-helix domain-containing protein n=1 Tax=Flavobacterium sp. 5 TaxID=2035199 RepID=UPI000CA6CF2D|nr:helix-turn-helix transcriptional regulator [Flavobacterium sp. 5]PKB18359.1 helix-turn-helix protein [Flavobacterium sp. 5]